MLSGIADESLIALTENESTKKVFNGTFFCLLEEF